MEFLFLFSINFSGFKKRRRKKCKEIEEFIRYHKKLKRAKNSFLKMFNLFLIIKNLFLGRKGGSMLTFLKTMQKFHLISN